jgi:hypothetical protein
MKYAPIALALAAFIAGSTTVYAQSSPTAGSAKPAIIDAAVTDNRYQLYEGEVVKIDKKNTHNYL